jgi:hypothetical protein
MSQKPPTRAMRENPDIEALLPAVTKSGGRKQRRSNEICSPDTAQAAGDCAGGRGKRPSAQGYSLTRSYHRATTRVPATSSRWASVRTGARVRRAARSAASQSRSDGLAD